MHWAIADAIFDGVVPDAGLPLAEGRQPRLDATIMSTCVPRSVSRCPASLLGIQGHSAAACGFHLHKNPAPMSREKAKGPGSHPNSFRTDSMKFVDFRSIRNVTFDKTASAESKHAAAMTTRRLPPPWHAEKIPGGYVVRDANGQRSPTCTAARVRRTRCRPRS
jgi:hypothetical protein